MQVFLTWMILALTTISGCASEETKKRDSAGWHGEGVSGDDADTADCNDFEMTMLDAEALFPSVVRIFFKLACDGRPVPDMADENFTILEDGSDISVFESSQQIVPTVAGYELSTLLLLDMSGSMVDAGLVGDLQEAATAFIDRLGGEHKVAIYLFDGREEIQLLVPFTDSSDLLLTGLATLSGYETVDSSTNLNGAILGALEAMDIQKLIHADKLFGGTLAVFTDGKDQAGRVSDSVARSRAEETEYSIYTIGLGAEIDSEHLSDVGRDGAFFADDVAGLTDVFDDVAQSIVDEANSLYLLAYCSPKRAGTHDLEVQLTGTGVSISRSFSADGFGAGCDPTDFVPAEFLDLDEDGYRPYDGDCDDDDPTRNPGEVEVCDELDNDCNGQVDDGVSVALFWDEDADGYGNPEMPFDSCEGSPGLVLDATDCNDLDPHVNPSAEEVCNAKDDDCDGFVDESESGETLAVYRDVDGDGFGDGEPIVVSTLCGVADGYTTIDDDCNDSIATVYPGADEFCNEMDDDCDGTTDEDPMDGILLYWDEDGDGVGDASETMVGCSAGDGWVASGIWSSCGAILGHDASSGDGIYSIDPDGGGAFDAWCDMSGGGWTLLGRYERNIRLDFDPTQDQVQGIGTIDEPPPLEANTGRGHIAFSRFDPADMTVKMDCGSDETPFHAVARLDLFVDWSEGDRGEVGSSEGWGVLRWNSVRTDHRGCGSVLVEDTGGVGAIGYCAGEGIFGSWVNHEVSATFHADTASDNVIGCNGEEADWMRVWLAPTDG